MKTMDKQPLKQITRNTRQRNILTTATLSATVLMALAGYCGVSRGMDAGNEGNVGGAASAASVKATTPPAATALAAIRALDFDWQDASRQRAVPVRLYMPQALSDAWGDVGIAIKPVPLIVFSHGLGGSRNGYQYLGRFWASQGYASLHVQHIGSDNQLWFGNPFGLAGRLQSAAQDAEAVARAKDVSFALTELLAQPQMAGRVDGNRIVAAGHSYGANTTMLLAGAAVPGKGDNGQTLNLRDPRIKAAMLLSAPPFYGYTNPAAILGGIALPTLHVTATGDDILVPGYGSGFEDRVNVFNAIGDARKTLVVFTGGSHSIFTDRANTGGVELNPKVKAATQALSLAFLKQTFGTDTANAGSKSDANDTASSQALADWQSKFADLLDRVIVAKLGVK